MEDIMIKFVVLCYKRGKCVFKYVTLVEDYADIFIKESKEQNKYDRMYKMTITI